MLKPVPRAPSILIVCVEIEITAHETGNEKGMDADLFLQVLSDSFEIN